MFGYDGANKNCSNSRQKVSLDVLVVWHSGNVVRRMNEIALR